MKRKKRKKQSKGDNNLMKFFRVASFARLNPIFNRNEPAKNTAKRHNGLLSKVPVEEEEATMEKRVESCWIMRCLENENYAEILERLFLAK